MEEGWICLHRKILKWEWYQDTNTFRVFMHLLLNANWEDTKYMGMIIPRGSLVVKQSKLTEQISLTTMQVRTALEKLERAEQITIKGYNKFTLVSIVNFNSYQDKNVIGQQTSNNQITNEQQSNNNQITSIDKQLNNITNNNINNIISAEQKYLDNNPEIKFKILLKDKSFYNICQEDLELYKELYPKVDIEQEIKNIAGWNLANPSKRKTKVGIKKHINTWLNRTNTEKGVNKNDKCRGNYEKAFTSEKNGGGRFEDIDVITL